MEDDKMLNLDLTNTHNFKITVTDHPYPEESDDQKSKRTANNVSKALPLLQRKLSLKHDMKFGWRPRIKIQDPPIPLFFNYSGFTEPTAHDCIEVYSGCRPRDSYDVHRLYANKSQSYIFKFPNLIQNAIYDYP